MNKNNEILLLFKKSIPWVLAISFILFYPMLISIYVFLPLMIGFVGYILILGIETQKKLYILMSVVYLINLEANLSLPLFLTLVVTLFYYVTIYPKLIIFKKCTLCVSLISILAINILYFVSIIGYDMIFDESSIVVDNLLLYSLIVDMLMVFLI